MVFMVGLYLSWAPEARSETLRTPTDITHIMLEISLFYSLYSCVIITEVLNNQISTGYKEVFGLYNLKTLLLMRSLSIRNSGGHHYNLAGFHHSSERLQKVEARSCPGWCDSSQRPWRRILIPGVLPPRAQARLVCQKIRLSKNYQWSNNHLRSTDLFRSSRTIAPTCLSSFRLSQNKLVLRIEPCSWITFQNFYNRKHQGLF